VNQKLAVTAAPKVRDVDWSESSVTLLRAAWDSHLNPSGFIAWLDRLGSQSHLLNTTSRVH
jgi:hypothetical protein